MRLIDADELKKSGYRLVHIDNLKPKQSCKSWAEVPTSYDVEKVLADLEELKISRSDDTPYGIGVLNGYAEAIEIVRRGGVE